MIGNNNITFNHFISKVIVAIVLVLIQSVVELERGR